MLYYQKDVLFKHTSLSKQGLKQILTNKSFHESPLTPIKGWVPLLIMRTSCDVISHNRCQLRSIINREGTKLYLIIADLYSQ